MTELLSFVLIWIKALQAIIDNTLAADFRRSSLIDFFNYADKLSLQFDEFGTSYPTLLDNLVPYYKKLYQQDNRHSLFNDIGLSHKNNYSGSENLFAHFDLFSVLFRDDQFYDTIVKYIRSGSHHSKNAKIFVKYGYAHLKNIDLRLKNDFGNSVDYQKVYCLNGVIQTEPFEEFCEKDHTVWPLD